MFLHNAGLNLSIKISWISVMQSEELLAIIGDESRFQFSRKICRIFRTSRSEVLRAPGEFRRGGEGGFVNPPSNEI